MLGYYYINPTFKGNKLLHEINKYDQNIKLFIRIIEFGLDKDSIHPTQSSCFDGLSY